MMTDGVKLFLTQLGMTKYYDMFVTKGFTLESDLQNLTSQDLEDALMITCQRDRSIILSQASTYQPSPEHEVYMWLRSNSLDYYFISFVQSELVDLKKIADLSLPNDDLYDELEIILPGHRKRLEKAVSKLREDIQRNVAAEFPVTHGWWGKPDCLPQAKFDFLCVKASVYKSGEPHNKVSVDFMVDSGSDVSTVQEDTLKSLNLDLIGQVYSCGIHGGNHTNLYRARLMVGDQEIDIEVMGSNYDSLGSRVVRHFRHVIDGHRHIWLKGNYNDPLPSIPALTLPMKSTAPAPAELSSAQKSLPPAAESGSCEAQQNISHTSTHLQDRENVISESVHTEIQHHDSTNPSTVKDSFSNVLNHKKTDNREESSSHEDVQASGAVTTDVTVTQNSLKNSLVQDKNITVSPHHLRHVASTSKGKGSVKSKAYGPKSSFKNKNGASCDRLPPDSKRRLPPNDIGDNPPTLGYDTKTGDLSSVGSSPNLSEKESDPSKKAKLDERVSLSNLIPPSLRDTDDDVDSLGLRVARSMAEPSPTLSPHTLRCKTTEALKWGHPLRAFQQDSIELPSLINPRSLVNDQPTGSCKDFIGDECEDRTELNDVVHIDDLIQDDEEVGDNCNEDVRNDVNSDVSFKNALKSPLFAGQNETLNSQKLGNGFVQASNEIVLVALDDLENKGFKSQGEIINDSDRITGHNPDSLSGGNSQQVVNARENFQSPRKKVKTDYS